MNSKAPISVLRSVVTLKCPACRTGDLFHKKGLFVYRKIVDMPETCPNCGQIYEIEPGFWIGALWMSYPLVVIIETPFLFLALFSEYHTWDYFGVMVIAFGLFFPLLIRLGRSVWAHIFIRYR